MNAVVVLRKIVGVSERILLATGVLCLFTVVVAISAGVISRKVFGNPFTWPEEIATFLFIWLSFVGAAVAASRRKHIFVDYFIHRIPVKYMKLITLTVNAFVLVFLLLICVGCVILQPMMAGHASVALNIPKNLYYLPVGLSALHMFFLYLADFIEDIQKLKNTQ